MSWWWYWFDSTAHRHCDCDIWEFASLFVLQSGVQKAWGKYSSWWDRMECISAKQGRSYLPIYKRIGFTIKNCAIMKQWYNTTKRVYSTSHWHEDNMHGDHVNFNTAHGVIRDLLNFVWLLNPVWRTTMISDLFHDMMFLKWSLQQ